MEAFTLGFELKQLSEDGTGQGFLSVMGNDDSYGDVVEKGAFTKTLRERNSENPVPFLWQHDSFEPIGIYTKLVEVDASFSDSPSANAVLYSEFAYALDVQRAREAYALAKMRACKGQSIGYTTIQGRDGSDGYRHLTELRLWEGSQVTFPANDLAVINGVKQIDHKWNGSASAYSDAEWKAACILDRGAAGGGSVKERYGLPVAHPGNSWRDHPDTGGVHAAADRIGEVHASPEARRSAYKRLVSCYHKIGETPPDSVSAGAKGLNLEDAAAIKALLDEIKEVREPGLSTRSGDLHKEIQSYLTSR